MDDAKKQGEDIQDSDYWYRVTDIPPAICTAFLKRLVIPERIMLKDIPEGKRLKDPEGSTYIETDGKVLSSLFMQEELFSWVFSEDYAGMSKKGEKQLWIARRLSTSDNWRIASSDIQTTNGVVQALGYDFKMINF